MTTTTTGLDTIAHRQLINRVRDALFAIMVLTLMAIQVASFYAVRGEPSSDTRTNATPATTVMSAQACDGGADGHPVC